MKMIDIALKDLTRSFRSAFAIVFMFGVPLMVTGMFYLMFGSMNQAKDLEIPITNVIVVNLDEGSPALQVGPTGEQQTQNLGEMLLAMLENKDLSSLLAVTRSEDAAAACLAVDKGQAQLAIIIPADFSANFANQGSQATLSLYQAAESSVGADVARSLVNRFADGLSGARIAVAVALAQPVAVGDPTTAASAVAQGYMAESRADDPHSLVAVRAANSDQPAPNLLSTIVGPLMGGMLIFYAFYTGSTTAQNILKEDEEGTLPRLFTTPTPRTTILAGKFLSVLLTVIVQVVVVLIAARLIFHVELGNVAALALAAMGIIIPATAFGIFFNALLRNTRQGSVLYGGVLTVSGMLGMLPIFTGGASNPALESVSLLVPQGWALRGLLQSMNGEPISAILLTLLVCLAWGAAFFAAGAWRFQKRFA